MPVLTLAETLAVPAPERESLVDADDAIRDLVSAVEEAVRRAGWIRGLCRARSSTS